MSPVSAHRIAELVDAVQRRLRIRGTAPTVTHIVEELSVLGALAPEYHAQPIAVAECVICGAAMASCDSDDPAKQSTTTMWRNGGVVSMSFGYGSRYDTGWVLGCICDHCAKVFVETTAAKMTEAGALGPNFSKHTIYARPG